MAVRLSTVRISFFARLSLFSLSCVALALHRIFCVEMETVCVVNMTRSICLFALGIQNSRAAFVAHKVQNSTNQKAAERLLPPSGRTN
jgi:hypothetical protein